MIDTYHVILQKIKDFSGEDDVDRLAAQFIKQEEENFALFNYVNELNNEVCIYLLCCINKILLYKFLIFTDLLTSN